MRNDPTANDILALLMTLVGLGIGALCFWGIGHIGTGVAVTGMVIGGIIALPPLLFWNVDSQRWEVTIRSQPTKIRKVEVTVREYKTPTRDEVKIVLGLILLISIVWSLKVSHERSLWIQLKC